MRIASNRRAEALRYVIKPRWGLSTSKHLTPILTILLILPFIYHRRLQHLYRMPHTFRHLTSVHAIFWVQVYALRLPQHGIQLNRVFFEKLFHNTLLQVLCQIRANLCSSTLCSYLGDIMLHHNLHQLLKTGLVRIPLQLGLCLSRITP